MKDELRDEIAYEYREWNPSASIGRALEFADFILSLIAPELEKARILNDKIGHLVATDIAVLVEKARKWDRVKEAADSRPPCKCPLWYNDACNLEYGGCIFRDVVDALTEKEPT